MSNYKIGILATIAVTLVLSACGGATILSSPVTAHAPGSVTTLSVPGTSVTATVAPTTTVDRPTTVAPAAPTTTVAAAPTLAPATTRAPVFVPVPYYAPTTVYYAPAPQAVTQPGTVVWGYYSLASYIPQSVYLHSATNLAASDLDQVYVGQLLGVICSVQGQEVTQYEDSTQWDYVIDPNNVYGWVADQFINVDGPNIPTCA